MIIGSFALIEPFRPIRRQFEAIAELGIEYVDLTDSHDGASLGAEYGFAATLSLDGHPGTIREMVEGLGLKMTSVCAHANLLDPTAPERYGTQQVIKAIRLASLLGIGQVITTEGDPHTDFGRSLSHEQMVFAVSEKLYEPVRWAKELGVELLIENHGELTDSLEGMERILDALGHEDTVGVNLDTGNCWLGGGEPLAFIERFGSRVRHVHWKDMGPEWESKRGKVFGCGMGTIPLGDGIVGIKEIVEALNGIGFDGPTTLEVAGAEVVKTSASRLRAWSSECEVVVAADVKSKTRLLGRPRALGAVQQQPK